MKIGIVGSGFVGAIRKSLFSDSKEITKPAVFAQPITLLELARSETDCTILPQDLRKDRRK
jgi:hypothetical protein